MQRPQTAASWGPGCGVPLQVIWPTLVASHHACPSGGDRCKVIFLDDGTRFSLCEQEKIRLLCMTRALDSMSHNVLVAKLQDRKNKALQNTHLETIWLTYYDEGRFSREAPGINYPGPSKSFSIIINEDIIQCHPSNYLMSGSCLKISY